MDAQQQAQQAFVVFRALKFIPSNYHGVSASASARFSSAGVSPAVMWAR